MRANTCWPPEDVFNAVDPVAPNGSALPSSMLYIAPAVRRPKLFVSIVE